MEFASQWGSSMPFREDVIIEVKAGHTAQIESWLLGHGRLPGPLPRADGPNIRYLVKDADPDTIAQLLMLGAAIQKRR